MNPTLADVGFNNHTNNQNFSLYSGTWSQSTGPDISHYDQTPGVPLTFHLIGTDGQIGGQICTQQMNQTAGKLPYILGSKKFYCEFDTKCDVFVMDNFPSVFMNPQEHNNTQSDILPSPPAPTGAIKYEAWSELDVMEGGFGAYEQASQTLHQWQGRFSALNPATIASASQVGVNFTTATNAYVGGEQVHLTGSLPSGFSADTPYFISATGLTTTNVQLSATQGGASISAGSSAACNLVTSYWRFTQTNIGSAALIDFTQRHRYGVGWNPQKRTVTFYIDDVQQIQYSAVNGGPGLQSLGYSDWSLMPWHYFMIMFPQTHGSNTPYSQILYNIQAWQ